MQKKSKWHLKKGIKRISLFLWCDCIQNSLVFKCYLHPTWVLCVPPWWQGGMSVKNQKHSRAMKRNKEWANIIYSSVPEQNSGLWKGMQLGSNVSGYEETSCCERQKLRMSDGQKRTEVKNEWWQMKMKQLKADLEAVLLQPDELCLIPHPLNLLLRTHVLLHILRCCLRSETYNINAITWIIYHFFIIFSVCITFFQEHLKREIN